MNIGIYGRKSIYSDKSDSIETQIDMCKHYISNNYSVDSIVVYKDEGYTGANVDRPAFKKLMQDIKNQKVDVLICYKIDRISRNVLDFSKTFNELQEHKVEFVSIKEQIDTSTPLGRAMMYICSVFAQMERETIAERVADNMIGLAKDGKWSGGIAPIGYGIKKVTINEKKHSMLIINQDEVPFVNMIFDKFLEGYTLSGMQTYFKNNNIKTLKGYFFTSSQIHKILSTPYYVENTQEIFEFFKNKGCDMACDITEFDGKHGVMVYGRTSGGKKKKHTLNPPDKWIVCTGLHEPIIGAEKWLNVQRRFGINKFHKKRKHEVGLLKGTLKCKCGCTMRTNFKHDKIYDKIYTNYFCPKRDKYGKEYCDTKSIAIDIIDDKIVSILKNIDIDSTNINKYVKRNTVSSVTRSKKQIVKDIADINKKINNLTSALHESVGSSAYKYIIAEIEKLDSQITSLNYELREVSITESMQAEKAAQLNELYDSIHLFVNAMDEMSYEQKNSYFKLLLKECVFDGNELSISL